MTPEDFARGSWQADSTALPLPPIAELRARAGRFRRKIVLRNLIEYVAGLFVLAMFGMGMVTAPLMAMRIGSALVVGGTLVVLWQLHRRASPLTPMEHGGQLSLLEYERRELARQRDALDSVFTWYLLPLIPGMLVILSGPLLSLPLARWGWPPAERMLVTGCVMAVFVGVYVLNKLAARRLQSQIEAIDALRAG